MKIRTKYFELTLTFMIRSERVRRDLAQHGKILAIKMYRERYGVDLKEAHNFIKSIDAQTGGEQQLQ